MGSMVESGRFSTNLVEELSTVMVKDNTTAISFASDAKNEKQSNTMANNMTIKETGTTNKLVKRAYTGN